MRKVMKRLAALLCAATLMMLAVIPASAASIPENPPPEAVVDVEEGDLPILRATPCGKCDKGVMTTYEKDGPYYSPSTTRPCVSGWNGVDMQYQREVRKYWHCGSCGHSADTLLRTESEWRCFGERAKR